MHYAFFTIGLLSAALHFFEKNRAYGLTNRPFARRRSDLVAFFFCTGYAAMHRGFAAMPRADRIGKLRSSAHLFRGNHWAAAFPSKTAKLTMRNTIAALLKPPLSMSAMAPVFQP
jgi:hypothetical protein